MENILQKLKDSLLTTEIRYNGAIEEFNEKAKQIDVLAIRKAVLKRKIKELEDNHE